MCALLVQACLRLTLMRHRRVEWFHFKEPLGRSLCLNLSGSLEARLLEDCFCFATTVNG